MIHIVKVFGIVNKADVFLEVSCFFDDVMDVGNLISGSSAFFKSSLNIWNFTVHVVSKPGLENFEHYFASMWDEFCWITNCCSFLWVFYGFHEAGVYLAGTLTILLILLVSFSRARPLCSVFGVLSQWLGSHFKLGKLHGNLAFHFPDNILSAMTD